MAARRVVLTATERDKRAGRRSSSKTTHGSKNSSRDHSPPSLACHSMPERRCGQSLLSRERRADGWSVGTCMPASSAGRECVVSIGIRRLTRLKRSIPVKAQLGSCAPVSFFPTKMFEFLSAKWIESEAILRFSQECSVATGLIPAIVRPWHEEVAWLQNLNSTHGYTVFLSSPTSQKRELEVRLGFDSIRSVQINTDGADGKIDAYSEASHSGSPESRFGVHIWSH